MKTSKIYRRRRAAARKIFGGFSFALFTAALGLIGTAEHTFNLWLFVYAAIFSALGFGSLALYLMVLEPEQAANIFSNKSPNRRAA